MEEPLVRDKTISPETLSKIQTLISLSQQVNESLVELVTTTKDIKRLDKIEKYLNWLVKKTKHIKEEPVFEPNTLPKYIRGDVILVDLGFNIGDEFGGEHYAVVLRDSNQDKKMKRVLILPITSKEPQNKYGIYLEIGKILGLGEHHWANIFNIINISKQRIIGSSQVKRVDGKILTRISGAIVSQVAIRKYNKRSH
ncbi:MAG: type II toxin-antitoxin system PemK/MazF family toxin [Desulfocucumaceae bacterium]